MNCAAGVHGRIQRTWVGERYEFFCRACGKFLGVEYEFEPKVRKKTGAA